VCGLPSKRLLARRNDSKFGTDFALRISMLVRERGLPVASSSSSITCPSDFLLSDGAANGHPAAVLLIGRGDNGAP
jgi:hypothetical protein